MLSDVRVLDLTDDRGLIGGMILADLGADVIAIEPTSGNTARRRGPFADGSNTGGIEDSLTWQSYSRGKRSVVLDLESYTGREHFLELARSADAVIESSDVSVMDALGIGYDALSEVNPGLIYAAITPFGSTGPKAGWAATDITVAAAAGPMIQSGDRDRPPLRVGLPQTALHAGAEAALGVLMGLHERSRSGRGQFIDVSAQAAYAQATQSGIVAAANNSGQFERSAVGAALGPLEIRLFWPCKDGHVAITYLFGAAIGPFTDRLMQYALEEGYCDQETRDKDWLNYTNLIL
ncbi:MAG: CoA transferase, partial [Chloroflexi bacterium]|nr:CoA transferase [Chloroflexota bacterium]